jgi:hypothetical protein
MSSTLYPDRLTGFTILVAILKLMHERKLDFKVFATGENEIALQTTNAHIQRHVLMSEENYVELFHLDNQDRRRSTSRLIAFENLDLQDVITFLSI